MWLWVSRFFSQQAIRVRENCGLGSQVASEQEDLQTTGATRFPSTYNQAMEDQSNDAGRAGRDSAQQRSPSPSSSKFQEQLRRLIKKSETGSTSRDSVPQRSLSPLADDFQGEISGAIDRLNDAGRARRESERRRRSSSPLSDNTKEEYRKVIDEVLGTSSLRGTAVRMVYEAEIRTLDKKLEAQMKAMEKKEADFKKLKAGMEEDMKIMKADAKVGRQRRTSGRQGWRRWT